MGGEEKRHQMMQNLFGDQSEEEEELDVDSEHESNPQLNYPSVHPNSTNPNLFLTPRLDPEPFPNSFRVFFFLFNFSGRGGGGGGAGGRGGGPGRGGDRERRRR